MNPVGVPGVRASYRPPIARINTSAPRSLSKNAQRGRGVTRMACAIRNDERDGLAGAGRPDHREIADLPAMEIEIVRRLAGRLQQRDRRTPSILVLLPDREIVERREADEVARGNQGAAERYSQNCPAIAPRSAGSAFMSSRTMVVPKVLQLLRRVLDAVLHLADRPAKRAGRSDDDCRGRCAQSTSSLRAMVMARLDLGSGLV